MSFLSRDGRQWVCFKHPESTDPFFSPNSTDCPLADGPPLNIRVYGCTGSLPDSRNGTCDSFKLIRVLPPLCCSDRWTRNQSVLRNNGTSVKETTCSTGSGVLRLGRSCCRSHRVTMRKEPIQGWREEGAERQRGESWVPRRWLRSLNQTTRESEPTQHSLLCEPGNLLCSYAIWGVLLCFACDRSVQIRCVHYLNSIRNPSNIKRSFLTIL